ncbi:MAG: CHAT domain-containing protein [Cyanobacteria bacterium P01_H01_bin.121]
MFLALTTACICGLADPVLATLGQHSTTVVTATLTHLKFETAYAETAPAITTQTAPNPQHLVAQSPLQQAIAAYQAGHYLDAIQLLNQVQHAGQTGITQTTTLRLLGMAQRQLGQLNQAQQTLAEGLTIANQLPPSRDRELVLAQILQSQGQLLLDRGQLRQAQTTFAQAEALYQAIQDLEGALTAQLNLAKVLQLEGKYEAAKEQLLRLQTQLQDQPPSVLKATGLRQLGTALQLTGDFNGAEQSLDASLAVAETIENDREVSLSQLAIANFMRENRIKAQSREIINRFQAAAAAAPTPLLRAQVLAAYLQVLQQNLVVQSQQRRAYERVLLDTVADLRQLLPQLPLNREAIYTRINVANSLLDYQARQARSLPDYREVTQLLEQSIEQAQQLGDWRSLAYAQGYLGKVHLSQGNGAEAESLTREALQLAELANAQELRYKWQAQLGRILVAEQRNSEAIATYESALAVFNQQVRPELGANSEFNLSFATDVEPAYRQYLNLLLPASDPGQSQAQPTQAQLAQVIDIIDSFHVQELSYFLGVNCATADPIDLASVEAERYAILYPILLDDRMAVILNVPGSAQPLRLRMTENVNQNVIEQAVDFLSRAILDDDNTVRWRRSRNRGERGSEQEGERGGETRTVLGSRLTNLAQLSQPLELAGQLYDWLIRDFEADLAAAQIETLIFVPDGPLKSLPIAVLYNNETDEYLLENYASATALAGLSLIQPQALPDQDLEILIGGLTEARQGFSPLPFVGTEIYQIANTGGVNASILGNDGQISVQQVFDAQGILRSTDQNFTGAPVEVAVEPLPVQAPFQKTDLLKNLKSGAYPVLHLATHGKFESDRDNNFVLTWDDRISIDDMQTLLGEQPPELLVLSACETAKGGELGLAGFAVRSGARSTVASLWVVEDEATAQLMGNFYSNLASHTMSKAEALRQAQLSLLNNSSEASELDRLIHPFYWAPFILVGNWL